MSQATSLDRVSKSKSLDPLAGFSEPVRRWFTGAFEAPTPAQAQAWPAIAAGEHVLLCAPTGSGKTLAAFLWGIDSLSRQPEADHTRLLYISPLKALSYDIERNLRTPLRGVGTDLKVAIRTGDTPQRERSAMARRPPDILITTPESLFLLLTSKARKMLGSVQSVIVDEIHAMASTKRGAHLALTLERLDALVGSQVQRIGLSATQRPLEEVARFLVGPQRKCTILDAGARKALDLRIEVPVESMRTPGKHPAAAIAGTDGQEQDALLGGAEGLLPLAGGESLTGSIWPAIYPRLLALVQEHRSTIVFVNSRRTAERVAARLNELTGQEDAGGGGEIARAHHGSLSREERTLVEEMLKAGQLPCLVATSSLELGVDMGAVDLVIQISSPKSVASGLQRVGRAGHSVGEPSKGRIFPRFRGDLLECAVLAKRMREGEIEPTVVPRNALDVLAQQIVASAAIEGSVSVTELHRRAQRTYSYAELSLAQLQNVLDMLDGRYPSSEFAELRPRIIWDRLGGVITPRQGAGRLAATNAGTIPDRGLYLVTLPDGRRVGELDEEMVYEARAGQAFMLGASTWRIEEIGRDRVIVTPAPGAPGAVPFWKGDGVGRPKQLGEAIGAFSRWAVEQPAEVLERDYDLDSRAAVNLLELLREQREATGVIPSDRTIVVERFRDEIGDWRLCVLSPYGGRIHTAWGLALCASIRSRLGLECDAIASDDGIVIHLPDTEEPPRAELALPEPEEVEDLIVAELSGSALFGARFRESAARALLIPRAMPGRRTPLWQQRLKAQSLLQVAQRYSQFPIILETYRECLSDVLDLAGLRELLAKLHRREISLVEVETPTASPFASGLLFDFLATHMYEGDTPSAERRAAALSLDRDLLRELLGQEELRELIDPGALADVEASLQRILPQQAARDADELHDLLRQIGDLSVPEVTRRLAADLDPLLLLRALRRQRRAIPLRIAGEERWVDAAEAGLYRDALGAAAPGGLPAAFLAEQPDALKLLLRRYAACNGPFVSGAVMQRYRLGRAVVESALHELQQDGELLRGELRPGGAPGEREWCEVGVLRRLRRASLAALRKEIEPVDVRAFAAFQASWQGIDSKPAAGAGIERLRETLIALQGLPLTTTTWERDVLPRRMGAYSPAWMDALCLSGELVWVGAGALGRTDGRVALYFREDAQVLGPPPGQRPSPEGELHATICERLRMGACFFTDLLVELSGGDAGTQARPQEIQDALWDLAWAGLVTNDAFAVLRHPRLTPASHTGSHTARNRRSGGRFAARRSSVGAGHPPGRWSLTEALFMGPASADPSTRRRANAELLLERYGVLSRELVRSEGLQGGFAALYDQLSRLETVGAARRGYFVEGLGGAQFALPGAVERLREARPDHAQISLGERSDVVAAGDVQTSRALVLAATDPAQPYGAALAWPASARRSGRGGRGGGRGPVRMPGAYVVLVDWEPVLYVERGGRGLLSMLAPHERALCTLAPRLRLALCALANAARDGRTAKLAIERLDGEPVLGSSIEGALTELGFSAGPRRLTLHAGS